MPARAGYTTPVVTRRLMRPHIASIIRHEGNCRVIGIIRLTVIYRC